MDEVHGGKMFWRQLNSRLGYGKIRNTAEPGQGTRKLWAPAPNPPTRVSVGRNGVTARRYRFYKLPTLHLFASPSHCSWSLDPTSLAQRTPDTTQPGQLHAINAAKPAIVLSMIEDQQSP